MKKMLLRIGTGIGVVACSLSLLVVAPQTTITAQAATGGGEIANPQSDIIGWVYAEFGDKLYKRLWNFTQMEWIGDWIYVRDL